LLVGWWLAATGDRDRHRQTCRQQSDPMLKDAHGLYLLTGMIISCWLQNGENYTAFRA
jgi:hypothetical protein